MAYKRKPDFFYKKAKAEGLVARSAFKLSEMQAKYRIFKPGDAVLDLGAAPGSWLQYVAEIVGESGLVVGVDMKAFRILPASNLILVDADVFSMQPAGFKKYRERFDVVISDLAPSTTGDRDGDHFRSMELCRRAFVYSRALLAENGHFVCKMFQGGETKAFLDSLKPYFDWVKIQKPGASRDESREIFLLGYGFKTQ